MSANLNITKLKLGQSANPAHNFLISTPQPEDGTLTIEREDGTDVMTIDATGKVSFPGEVIPAFLAYGVTQTLTVNVSTKANVSNEEIDTNNNYDPVNKRFTPTVAGYYQVNATGGNQAALDTFGIYISIIKNGTDGVGFGGSTGNAYTYARGSASGLTYMNGTTDYLEVFLVGTGPSGTVNCVCNEFSAVLVKKA